MEFRALAENPNDRDAWSRAADALTRRGDPLGDRIRDALQSSTHGLNDARRSVRELAAVCFSALVADIPIDPRIVLSGHATAQDADEAESLLRMGSTSLRVQGWTTFAEICERGLSVERIWPVVIARTEENSLPPLRGELLSTTHLAIATVGFATPIGFDPWNAVDAVMNAVPNLQVLRVHARHFPTAALLKRWFSDPGAPRLEWRTGSLPASGPGTLPPLVIERDSTGAGLRAGPAFADDGDGRDDESVLRSTTRASKHRWSWSATTTAMNKGTNEDGYAVDGSVFSVVNSTAGSHDAVAITDAIVQALREHGPLIARIRNAERMVAAMATGRLQGCTASLASLSLDVDDPRVCWVGGCRVYRLRRADFTRLTRDHTMVEELLVEGALEPENPMRSKFERIATQSLRRDHHAAIGSEPVSVERGDRFLLCTCGVSDVLDDDVLHAILFETPDPKICVSRLIAEIRRCGGWQDATALIVDVHRPIG